MVKKAAKKKALKKVAASPRASGNVETSSSKYTATIGKGKAAELILANKMIQSITFKKKNGTERTLTGRHGVSTGVKGTGTKTNAKLLGQLKFYDMVDHGWKTVNLQTVTRLKANKKVYRVN